MTLLRLAVILLVATACKAREPATPTAAPDAGSARPEGPPPAAIVVDRKRTDLVFTYVDPSGQFHDVTTIDEVPEDSRAQVLVRDLSKSPDEVHAADYLYVADLRTADPSGRYPCGAVSRFGFERKGAREAAQKAAEEAAGRGESIVVVYSTTWCGVCKSAKAWLRQQGIPFVERDVEKDPGASNELASKATAAGVRPSGVPVIDVAGELMVGFDAGALSALVEKKGLKKTL
jgi:glutaredoxin